MFCVDCLAGREPIHADVVWGGYSFCIKHFVEYQKAKRHEWHKKFQESVKKYEELKKRDQANEKM